MKTNGCLIKDTKGQIYSQCKGTLSTLVLPTELEVSVFPAHLFHPSISRDKAS